VWIAALVVTAICVGGLAYALIVDWNTEPTSQPLHPTRTTTSGSGFGIGLVVGIGAGIVIGSLLVLRKRQP
jgi:hypothetical protein